MHVDRLGYPTSNHYDHDMEERYTDRRMPRLVNVEGAADILGFVPQYVYRLADSGKLKGARIGSAWIFRRVEVERFRDTGGAKKPPQPPVS
jgi:excisionase family DNA binding protein